MSWLKCQNGIFTTEQRQRLITRERGREPGIVVAHHLYEIPA